VTKNIKALLPHIQNHTLFDKYDFRLVGGTALSYHINHRISEDLDFCLTKPLPLDDIAIFIEDCTKQFGIENIEYIQPSRAMMEDFLIGGDNVEYYLQTWIINRVKIQFFDGSSNLGTREFLKNDRFTNIGNIKLSSLDTIFKMKSLMFYKRTKARDLFDMLSFYQLGNSNFSALKTKELIMSFEKLYNTEDSFKLLWLESFKDKTYIKERDEGLFGLTNNIKTYQKMRDELVKIFEKLD
jgi:predicted nucleotidyltransferase component of viral defense system